MIHLGPESAMRCYFSFSLRIQCMRFGPAVKVQNVSQSKLESEPRQWQKKCARTKRNPAVKYNIIQHNTIQYNTIQYRWTGIVRYRQSMFTCFDRNVERFWQKRWTFWQKRTQNKHAVYIQPFNLFTELSLLQPIIIPLCCSVWTANCKAGKHPCYARMAPRNNHRAFTHTLKHARATVHDS